MCLSGSSLSFERCVAWPWERSLFRYSSGGLASPGSTCELDLDQICCRRKTMLRMDEQHTTKLVGRIESDVRTDYSIHIDVRRKYKAEAEC